MAKRRGARSRASQARPSAGPAGPPPAAEAARPAPPPAGPRAWGERLQGALGHRHALPVILAVAALLRIGHVFALRGTPFFDNLLLDPRAYDEWAQRIAAGAWLGGPGAFFVDPLYAWFLAVLYRTFGHDLLIVRLVQAALGVGTVWLTARVGRRALGSEPLGNGAALLMAFFLPAVHAEAAIEKTALATFLLTLALDLYLRERDAERGRPAIRLAAAAGAVLALAALARGNLLVLVPVGALGLWLEGGADWRARARRAAPFVAGAAVVVALVAARNVGVAGEWVLTTANAGQNLYIGHHPENEHGTYRAPSFVRPDPRYEEADFRAEAERREGRALSARAVSSYWTLAALRSIAAQPGAALARTWNKLRLLWHQWETPDNDHVDVVAEVSPLLRLPFVWMGELFPLALLGAVAWWKRRREMRLLALALAASAAGIVAFFVLSRFRVPLGPILAVLAAGGAAWLAEAVRARDRRRLAIGGAAVAAAALFAFVPPDWMAAERRSALAVAYNNLGSQLLERGDTDGAIRAYERAVATSDVSVVAALRSLGDLYLARGAFDRAEPPMRRVVELKPESTLGWQALVRLYEAMLRDPAHSADPAVRTRLAEAYRALGRGADADRIASGGAAGGAAAAATGLSEAMGRARALREAGRPGEAIATLKEAIRTGPYDEDARYFLGGLMEAHATPEEMVAFWSAGVASDPKPQTSLYWWAAGLERSGDLEAAKAKLALALDVDPAHEMSEHRWGAILEREGRLADALEHYLLATEIHPEFRAAHESAARVLSALGREEEARLARERARTSDPGSPRRFFYWARWLAKHGRTDAAVAELERALRARPADAESRALLEELRPGAAAAFATGGASPGPPGLPRPGPGSGAPGFPGPGGAPYAIPGAGAPAALDPATRAAIVGILRGQPTGTPVWIAAFDRDPARAALAAALRDAFVEAGWDVRGERPVTFGMKAGVYLFSADDEPPDYVATVHDALTTAGFAPTVGSGYRAYYEEMARTKPGFQGFAMAPDQTYLVVIGP